MAEHCGTCAHHGFKGTQNWCRLKDMIIWRFLWDLKNESWQPHCWCEDYRDWEVKALPGRAQIDG